MNLPRANKCVLVIPDAGPLISLWNGDSLDLLKKIKLPLAVVDIVKYEVTNTPEKYPQGREIEMFLNANSLQINTDIGRQFLKLKELDPTEKPIKDIGEYAIFNFVKQNLPNINRTNPVLILFEDNFVPKLLNECSDKVHLLSTVGFLKRLEEKHIIQSVDEIIEKIKDNGRNLNMLDFEKQTDTGSSWLPEM